MDRLVALKDQTRYLNAWSEEPDGLDELLLEALIDAVFAERYGEIEVGKRRGGIRVPGAALTAPWRPSERRLSPACYNFRGRRRPK